ncbi:MAG: SRPBCC domain-containing protein [bacterium]
MKRWFGPEGFDSSLAEVDLRVGGAFRFHLVGPDGAVHVAAGEYREIEPPKRLVFTWGWETGANPFESRVTIELTPAGKGGTEFVMTHDLFPDEATRNSHESGWNGSLDKLQKILG